MFLFAAEGLSALVTPEDLAVGRVYPPLSNIKDISLKIATKVAEEAYKDGMASVYPEPKVKAKIKDIRQMDQHGRPLSFGSMFFLNNHRREISPTNLLAFINSSSLIGRYLEN